jgi:hypothetical protein
MRVVFLVLASNTTVNENDLVMQQKTWARNDSENSTILWVRGKDISDYSLDFRQLYVPLSESYENILEKTLLGIRWILSEYDPDFIVRTNVSTYFSLKDCEEFLKEMHIKEIDLLGYPEVTGIRYSFVKKSFQFLSGAGIILSKRAANLLLNLESKLYEGVPDDVAISHFFEAAELRKRLISRSNLGYTRVFIPHWYIRLKSSEKSSLTQSRFSLVDEYYKKKSLSAFWRIQWQEFVNIQVHDVVRIARMNFLAIKRLILIRMESLSK